MLKLLSVAVTNTGELSPDQIETQDGITDVHIATDDGATFIISARGDKSIDIHTRDGHLLIEPESANWIVLKQVPN